MNMTQQIDSSRQRLSRDKIFSLPVQALEVVLAQFDQGAKQATLARTSSGFVSGVVDGMLAGVVEVLGVVHSEDLRSR